MEKMNVRKHWIDNLRWVTVLLVLLYHVVYFYNNKGVFGGVGGFGEYPECPQYQDVVMYILYPWFMPLLFILAGIGARYALRKHSARDWFKARTRKLLVPGTIGLLVFHWMTGYFNTVVAARQGVFDGVPAIGKYLIMAVSGIGPLWFIQVLWLMCLAMMAWFQAKYDCTSPFAAYMTKCSFGLYIVHYLVIAGFGYMMKTYTQLPPWVMYVILALAVFTLSPLLYEIIHRIPSLRWCVLGESRKNR